MFNVESLGATLYVHVNGFNIYVKRQCPMVRKKEDDKQLIVKYSQGREIEKAKKVYKADMKVVHKQLFEFVNIYVLPRSEKMHEDKYIDMYVMEVHDENRLLNVLSMMIKHLAKVVDPSKGEHAVPNGFFALCVV